MKQYDSFRKYLLITRELPCFIIFSISWDEEKFDLALKKYVSQYTGKIARHQISKQQLKNIQRLKSEKLWSNMLARLDMANIPF